MAEENRYFSLVIVTPGGVFYRGETNFLELPAEGGRIGVYKEHIPLTTVLAPGLIKIAEQEGEKLAAAGTGFATILKDRVTVLVEKAEWEKASVG